MRLVLTDSVAFSQILDANNFITHRRGKNSKSRFALPEIRIEAEFKERLAGAVGFSSFRHQQRGAQKCDSANLRDREERLQRHRQNQPPE